MLRALGFGKSESKQKSSQSIWGPQAEALTGLYSDVGNFVSQNNPYLDAALASGSEAIGATTPYVEGALPAWQNLVSGGANMGMDYSNLYNMASGEGMPFNTYQAMMQGSANPWLAAMAESGLGRMFENYDRNIRPMEDLARVNAGGYGTSRHGVIEANKYNDMMRSGADFMTNLYGGAYDADMSRALTAAQSMNQDQLRAMDMQRMVAGGIDAATGAGLNQAQNAMNLGFVAPNMYNTLYQMQWQPYSMQKDIYGAPTTLTQSSGKSNSISGSIGWG